MDPCRRSDAPARPAVPTAAGRSAVRPMRWGFPDSLTGGEWGDKFFVREHLPILMNGSTVPLRRGAHLTSQELELLVVDDVQKARWGAIFVGVGWSRSK